MIWKRYSMQKKEYNKSMCKDDKKKFYIVLAIVSFTAGALIMHFDLFSILK